MQQTLGKIRYVIHEMNKADLGIFYSNPTFARDEVAYTSERAEGMRYLSEGQYDEALLHLERAYSILRSSPDWAQLE